MIFPTSLMSLVEPTIPSVSLAKMLFSTPRGTAPRARRRGDVVCQRPAGPRLGGGRRGGERRRGLPPRGALILARLPARGPLLLAARPPLLTRLIARGGLGLFARFIAVPTG